MAIPKYHWNIVQFAGTELGLSDEGPHFWGTYFSSCQLLVGSGVVREVHLNTKSSDLRQSGVRLVVMCLFLLFFHRKHVRLNKLLT